MHRQQSDQSASRVILGPWLPTYCSTSICFFWLCVIGNVELSEQAAEAEGKEQSKARDGPFSKPFPLSRRRGCGCLERSELRQTVHGKQQSIPRGQSGTKVQGIGAWCAPESILGVERDPPAYHRPIIPVFMAKSIGDKTCRHSQTRDNRPKARGWNSDETRLTD